MSKLASSCAALVSDRLSRTLLNTLSQHHQGGAISGEIKMDNHLLGIEF